MFSNEKGVTAVQVSELTRHAEKPLSGEPQNESFGVKICQANKTILVARVVRKKKNETCSYYSAVNITLDCQTILAQQQTT